MVNKNGLTLAYIGDAIYELKIRERLISRNIDSVNKLHNEAIKYTCAKAQAYVFETIKDSFNEEEIDAYKRGRNATTNHKPKHASLQEYIKATGFEALIGYLYLDGQNDRIVEIVDKTIEVIDSTLKSND